MKKDNLRSRPWKEFQNGMVSNQSLDCFESLVSAWWALRRAKKAEREMQESFEQLMQVEEEAARERTKETSSNSEARHGGAGNPPPLLAPYERHQGETKGGDGLLKYVVLYALTLLLQPILTFVLFAAVLWGLGHVLLWLFLS